MIDGSQDNEFKQVYQHFSDLALMYEDLETTQEDEHVIALNYLLSQIDYYGINSLLDIGAGVGTDLLVMKKCKPNLKIVGCEPVAEMRAVGHSRGLAVDELVDGNIMALDLPDKSFDCVSEFAVLHHVKDPTRAVEEMIRVAKKAVFISDANCFGMGHPLTRLIKQCAHAIGAWPLVDYIKSGGKGYYISEGDGLFYSYSTFFNYSQLERVSKIVHIVNTKGTGVNPYRNATHTAFLAILK